MQKKGLGIIANYMHFCNMDFQIVISENTNTFKNLFEICNEK